MGNSVYCIIYLNKYWESIEKDLKKHHYEDLKSYIPVVKLTERAKSKDTVDKPRIRRVPLLFNYGFIKMPVEKALDRIYLRKIVKKIPGVAGFLKSPSTMHQRRIMKKIDNVEDFDDFSLVAIATISEIKEIKRVEAKGEIFTKEDIVKLRVGDSVFLKSYPFYDTMAEILDININQKKAKVRIYPESDYSMKVVLPLEDLMYTVYRDFDDNIDDCQTDKPDYTSFLENLIQEPDEFEL